MRRWGGAFDEADGERSRRPAPPPRRVPQRRHGLGHGLRAVAGVSVLRATLVVALDRGDPAPLVMGGPIPASVIGTGHRAEPTVSAEPFAPYRGEVDLLAAPDTGLDAAIAVLRGRPLVALTGAGLSTDSGIPDYRGPGTPRHTPMTYQEFVSGEAARRRYWARSHVGWSRVRRAVPNAGHTALVALEDAGVLRGLITQNVDGLHPRAGSRTLVELHGRITEVVCRSCRAVTAREDLQRRLAALNPGFARARAELPTALPDGDADLTDVDGFVLADCTACGGVLKPDVVFFGEIVPPDRVTRCRDWVDALTPDGALLVAGSSLHLMSGLRFVRQAHRAGVPVVIVNRGPGRGDDLATVRVDAGCSETLTALAEQLA
jgi:NAD-dependent SIR2 family protein deacetylase